MVRRFASEGNGLITRRDFGAITAGALVSCGSAAACRGSAGEAAEQGRIVARPGRGSRPASGGTTSLHLGESRDALLQLPDPVPEHPLPLCVLLHGAGGAGAGILRRLGKAAAEAGLAVLAPDSRDDTWDAVRGDLGPDIRFLNRALERVFSSASIDAARVSIGGFSDGATYALTVGLMNGDVFRRIAAFSPGFVVAGAPVGKPRIFISHGRGDTILPIDRCSRRIVPDLQRRGYEVTYREFDGAHTVPADVARDGLRWAAG